MSKVTSDISAGFGHVEDKGSLNNVMVTLGVNWFSKDAKEIVKKVDT